MKNPGSPKKHLLFSAMLLSAAFSAAAQNGDSTLQDVIQPKMLQETVVTGVPVPVKMQNALSNYRVISKAAMKAQGAVNVAEALSTQLGIRMGNDGVLGSNISMQGLGGDKVKILVDGLPVNGRENGNIDLGQLSLNNVERIEIIQGPMSVIYGSDALGGVINIITRKPKKKVEGSAGFNYETVGRYNVDVAGAAQFDERNTLQAGFGRNFSEGYGYLDTAYPQRAQIFKPKEQWLGNVAYRYKSRSGIGLMAASDFVAETVINRGTVNGWPYFATASDEYYHTWRSINRLSVNGTLGKGTWKLENGYAWYRRVRETMIKDLTTLEEVPSTVAGSQDTSLFTDITLRSNYANAFGRLRYDGGYDLLFQRGQSGKFGGESHTADNYALYANLASDFLEKKLTAQIGLRGSYNTVYSVPLVYSANLLYKPMDHLQLRASYARGFRAPSLKEQYLEFIDQNHHVIGNPNLKPEHGHHLQASATLQYGKPEALKVGMTLTGFYNDVRDVITLANPDSDPNSINRVYANMARQQNASGMLEWEGQYKEMYLLLGGILTHTFAADSGYEAFNVPELTATARYLLKPAKLVFSLFYKYTGASKQLSALPDGSAIYDVTLPAYNLMDVSASRTFFKSHLDLTAGIKNVFDIQTLSPTGVSTSAHSSGGGNLLPRRLFVTVRVAL
jgi:outer membrane receptor for ferrienterochelin and colicins